VPERSRHPPLERLGIGPGREHVRIVIALEQQRFAAAQEPIEPGGKMAEIRYQPELRLFRLERQSDLGCVMGNRTRADRDITDAKRPPDHEWLSRCRVPKSQSTQGGLRGSYWTPQAGRIGRCVRGMVAMTMRDQDSRDILGDLASDRLETLNELSV
jgi:hypothetical protein